MALGTDNENDIANELPKLSCPPTWSERTTAGDHVILPTEEEAGAIGRLLKRPWFSRVWVIQEVGVANEVIVLCGDRKINFDVLFIGSSIIMVLSRHLKMDGPGWIHGILLLAMIGEWKEKDVALLTTESLLYRCREFHSTDLRDNYILCMACPKPKPPDTLILRQTIVPQRPMSLQKPLLH